MPTNQPTKGLTDIFVFRINKEIQAHLSEQKERSAYLRNLILSDMLNPCRKDKEAMQKCNL